MTQGSSLAAKYTSNITVDGRGDLFLSSVTDGFEHIDDWMDYNEDMEVLLDASQYVKGTKRSLYNQGDVHYELTDFIILWGEVLGAMSSNMGKPIALAAINTAIKNETGISDVGNKIINDVYLNWKNVDEKIKKFYRKYFVFGKLDGTKIWDGSKINGFASGNIEDNYMELAKDVVNNSNSLGSSIALKCFAYPITVSATDNVANNKNFLGKDSTDVKVDEWNAFANQAEY